jgi:hypothetical protein
LRLIDARHWMASAVKRTIIPFALTTLFVTGMGSTMQAHVPDARSLGDIIGRR